MLPLSPGGKGQTTESGTNLLTNKAMELITKKETTKDLAVSAINAIDATPKQMGMQDKTKHPTLTAKTRGGGEKLVSHLAPFQTTWQR